MKRIIVSAVLAGVLALAPALADDGVVLPLRVDSIDMAHRTVVLGDEAYYLSPQVAVYVDGDPGSLRSLRVGESVYVTAGPMAGRALPVISTLWIGSKP